MYRKFAAAVMIVGWVLFSCLAGLAHHSVAANFDTAKTVAVVGSVKEVEIRRPQAQIRSESGIKESAFTSHTGSFQVRWWRRYLILCGVVRQECIVAPKRAGQQDPCWRHGDGQRQSKQKTSQPWIFQNGHAA